jgi:Tol biopolymer transport system component
MTSTNDFERDVSAWFHADAEHRVSPHLDAVLRRTRSERQRSAWSSLERWLPMQSTAHFAPAPRLVWLLAVVGLVLALSATAIFIGSRRTEPSPFGESSRGTVLYSAADGDIYALDTASNQATTLIQGETLDADPMSSPDGSTFVFTRRLPGGSTPSLMIAAADGSDIRTLVGGVTATGDISWSPSGDRLAVIGTVEGRRGLWIVGTDGTRTLVRPEEGGTGDGLLREPTWLPNGQDLLFVGGPIDTGTPTAGLYQVHADGSDVRSIVAPKVPGPTQSSLSPDGSRVAFAVGTSERSGTEHSMGAVLGLIGPRLSASGLATAPD